MSLRLARPFTLVLACLALCVGQAAFAQPMPPHERTERVIYGEKYSTALLMDVFQPKQNHKGKAIILVVSGGWLSGRAAIDRFMPREFLQRGYTVFAVTHGTQPKFTIPEILEDMHRAVRFIRFNAEKYKIDPDHIGIYGGSAGGHLSLMMGTTGTQGDPNAPDPVDRVSSRVQAVACFFPPTDFLNYGESGQQALGDGILAAFAAPFDFHEMNKQTGRFERITDPERRREIGKVISPVTHVTSDDAPTLIVHGDADPLVPYQQAVIMMVALKKAGVESQLVTKEGAAHGWNGWFQDIKPHADWFDKHLNTP